MTELPGQVYLDDARPHIRVSRTDFYECPNLDSVVLTADISIFMDNGLPFAINSYDLVIWNASSLHNKERSEVKGERSWRKHVCEAGRSRRWC